MEFAKALSLIVLCLTAWSAIALLLDRRGFAQVNRWFAGLLFCLCVPQVYFYSCYIQPPNGVFWLALAAQATLWLKGPVLFAMVKRALGRPTGYEYLHLIPFLLVLVAMFWQPVWMFEWGLLGFFHAMGYLLACAYLFSQHKQRLQLILHGFQNSAYFWLVFVVLGMSVLLVLDASLMLFAYIERNFLPSAVLATNWLISLYLLSLAFFSIYRPELFFHQNRIAMDADVATEAAIEITVETSPADTKAWRELNESLAQSLASRLNELMQCEALYRCNELSLGDLAAHLDISVHQTSELLNVYFAENFYDYINRYRLAYACQLLADADCQLRVLDIAFESGFSNKNSFYRYFRETYGMTPVEYRQRSHSRLKEETC